MDLEGQVGRLFIPARGNCTAKAQRQDISISPPPRKWQYNFRFPEDKVGGARVGGFEPRRLRGRSDNLFEKNTANVDTDGV